ncbi:hypothetical protein Tco_0643299, partial [Tanacetum coccineum]
RTVQLFESMLVPQGEGSEHPTEPQHTPLTQPKSPPQVEQTTSQELIPQETTIQTTSQDPITQATILPSQSPRRFTRGAIRISHSKAPSPGADKTASPTRDDSHREAFPTATGLDAGQDRENIAKTSAMPHEASPNHQGEDLGVKKSTEKGSDNTYEVANVLSTMKAANVLSSGGALSYSRLVVALVSEVSPLVSANFYHCQCLNTQLIQEEQETSRGFMIVTFCHSTKCSSVVQKGKRERSGNEGNELIAKYMSEYEQAKAGLSLEEKIELITELVKYQNNLAEIHKYQAQQSKPSTKKEKRNFYMAILKSHAGMQDFSTFFLKLQDQNPLKNNKPKILKNYLRKKTLKEMMEEDLGVPVEEVYIKALQKAFSTADPTEDKETMLWVELKRLYEPNPRDTLPTMGIQ